MLDCSFVLQMSGYWSLSCENYMVMALKLEISKALTKLTKSKWTVGPSMAQFSLALFGFPALLLSTLVICPFHQTFPHSVIKGHLGIISFLNLAFGGISCSRSLFIFMSINCWAPSNPKQTGRPAFPLVALLQTVYSPPSPSYFPPNQFHNTTYKTVKHTEMHTQTRCPWALVVLDYLQFT